MSIKNIDLAKAIIVDVRPEAEYAKGHTLGAINIPLEKVEERLAEFEKIQGDIVLCCNTGKHSKSAIEILQKYGVKNLYDGGGWSMLNLQLLNVS